MIKKFRKVAAFVGVSAVTSMIPISATFAMDYTFENSLITLAQPSPDGDPVFVSPDKVISDTYWGNLEEGSVTNVDGQVYYGVFPKYLLKPNETALKNVGISSSGQGSIGYFPSSGITLTDAGMKIIDMFGFYRFGYLVGDDTYAPPYTDRPATEAIPDRVNPFNFKESDLLSQAEINDSTKLTVFADIKEKSSLDSSKIGEYEVGDDLNLEFSMNASWLKRFIMGHTLDMTRTGYMSDDEIQSIYNETKGMFDAQFVYTIDLPKEVELQNPQVTLSGLKAFDITSEVKNNGDIKTLVVSLRLNKDKQAKAALWKETIEEIKKLDTSNIKISISGLSISPIAKPQKNVTLIGTASGYFEWALSKDANIVATNPDASHMHLYFLAKQNDDGRDINADQNKPNLISYTFDIKKAEHNTVTFIHEDNEYDKVKVEKGKSISGDNLENESMPKSPSKQGHSFVEWNTKADGSGDTFDDNTLVHTDITVYAIHVAQNKEHSNEAPVLEVKDATSKKGKDFDLKSLVVKATDKEDGDLTKSVKLIDDGGFNKDKVGEYIITFEVTDSQGAKTIATAKVIVKEDVIIAESNNEVSSSVEKSSDTKTGNKNNIIFYGISIALSTLAILAIVFYRRKVKK